MTWQAIKLAIKCLLVTIFKRDGCYEINSADLAKALRRGR